MPTLFLIVSPQSSVMEEFYLGIIEWLDVAKQMPVVHESMYKGFAAK